MKESIKVEVKRGEEMVREQNVMQQDSSDDGCTYGGQFVGLSAFLLAEKKKKKNSTREEVYVKRVPSLKTQ